MLAFNLFKALAQNTDRLVIGPLLGVRALGLYTLAYRAIIYPVTTFVGALGAYLFPRIARLQSDPVAVRAVYRAVLVAILNLVLPGLAVLAILAPFLVPLLGERWVEAVPIFQILAIAGLAQALMAPVGQMMKGLGRPGWLILWSVGLTAVTAVALLIGTRWGLTGASIAYSAAHMVALPVILLIGWRLTGLGTTEIVGVAWRPVISTMVLGGALLLIVQHLGGWSPWLVAASAAVAAPLYLLGMAHLNPEFKGLAARELRKLGLAQEGPATVAPPASRR
jgi:PST family polysaccharide transporter